MTAILRNLQNQSHVNLIPTGLAIVISSDGNVTIVIIVIKQQGQTFHNLMWKAF